MVKINIPVRVPDSPMHTFPSHVTFLIVDNKSRGFGGVLGKPEMMPQRYALTAWLDSEATYAHGARYAGGAGDAENGLRHAWWQIRDGYAGCGAIARDPYAICCGGIRARGIPVNVTGMPEYSLSKDAAYIWDQK